MKQDPLVLRQEFRRKQVKAARALLGWAQHVLAEHAKVSPPTVANYETGRRCLSRKADDIFKALEKAGISFTEWGVEIDPKQVKGG